MQEYYHGYKGDDEDYSFSNFKPSASKVVPDNVWKELDQKFKFNIKDRLINDKGLSFSYKPTFADLIEYIKLNADNLWGPTTAADVKNYVADKSTNENTMNEQALRQYIKKQIETILNEDSSTSKLTLEGLRQLVLKEIDECTVNTVQGAYDKDKSPESAKTVNWQDYETKGPNHEMILGPDESPKVKSLLNYVKSQTPSMAKFQDMDVEINKILPGDVAKYKVFVKDPMSETVKKIEFGKK